MPEESNCVAQTPPPADAKPAPKLLGCCSATVQPDVVPQSVSLVAPLWFTPVAWVHPVLVCSAIWLYVMRLTASMTSISPPAGQLMPFVQNEGHTCERRVTSQSSAPTS